MCIRKHQARPSLINSHDCIYRKFDFLGLDTKILKDTPFLIDSEVQSVQLSEEEKV